MEYAGVIYQRDNTLLPSELDGYAEKFLSQPHKQ